MKNDKKNFCIIKKVHKIFLYKVSLHEFFKGSEHYAHNRASFCLNVIHNAQSIFLTFTLSLCGTFRFNYPATPYLQQSVPVQCTRHLPEPGYLYIF